MTKLRAPAPAKAPARVGSMALANTEGKKGGRQKRSTQKRPDSEKESRNAEVERQIQGEMKRIQEENMVLGVASGLEAKDEEDGKEEMEDRIDQKVETMNKNSVFGFSVPRPPIATRKSISELPIIPTKISKDSRF